MQLSLRTDRNLLRAGSRSTRHLLVSITAPAAAARAERLPVHVGIVLDRSGSMGGGKFELAREAVEQSLRMLTPADRFTLVVFDTQTDVLAPAVQATAAAKREALLRLAEVEPRGSTDLHSGWMAAATGLAAVLDARAVTRVLLLTDGQANAGIVDPHALAGQAETLRGRGIVTSTFGIGEDFDERILRDIAHATRRSCSGGGWMSWRPSRPSIWRRRRQRGADRWGAPGAARRDLGRQTDTGAGRTGARAVVDYALPARFPTHHQDDAAVRASAQSRRTRGRIYR